MSNQRLFTTIQWMLGSFIVLLMSVAWTDVRLDDGAEKLTFYDVFAVYGLLAFGLMWTHFTLGSLRRLMKLPPVKTLYSQVTMIAVLAFLLLHVGLLSFSLWHDGFGLPPASYLSVYSYASVAIILGSISLVIFLAYELHRWHKAKPWWKYIEALQIGAMMAIFYHGLALGQELSRQWFSAVWWMLGMTLVIAAVYNYRYDRRKNVWKEGQMESKRSDTVWWMLGLVLVLAVVGVAAYMLLKPVQQPGPTIPDEASSKVTAENDSTRGDSVEATTITFTNDGFSDSQYTTKVNQPVTVINNSDMQLQFSSDDHPAHTDQLELNLPVLEPGDDASFTPTRLGIWGFHDHLNSQHTGRLEVVE